MVCTNLARDRVIIIFYLLYLYPALLYIRFKAFRRPVPHFSLVCPPSLPTSPHPKRVFSPWFVQPYLFRRHGGWMQTLLALNILVPAQLSPREVQMHLMAFLQQYWASTRDLCWPRKCTGLYSQIFFFFNLWAIYNNWLWLSKIPYKSFQRTTQFLIWLFYLT